MFYGNDPRPGDNQEHPIKVEKDEYVVNRNAARKHRDLLDYINFVDEPRYDNKEMAHSSIDEAIALNTLTGMQEGGAVQDKTRTNTMDSIISRSIAEEAPKYSMFDADSRGGLLSEEDILGISEGNFIPAAGILNKGYAGIFGSGDVSLSKIKKLLMSSKFNQGGEGSMLSQLQKQSPAISDFMRNWYRGGNEELADKYAKKLVKEAKDVYKKEYQEGGDVDFPVTDESIGAVDSLSMYMNKFNQDRNFMGYDEEEAGILEKFGRPEFRRAGRTAQDEGFIMNKEEINKALNYLAERHQQGTLGMGASGMQSGGSTYGYGSQVSTSPTFEDLYSYAGIEPSPEQRAKFEGNFRYDPSREEGTIADYMRGVENLQETGQGTLRSAGVKSRAAGAGFGGFGKREEMKDVAGSAARSEYSSGLGQAQQDRFESIRGQRESWMTDAMGELGRIEGLGGTDVYEEPTEAPNFLTGQGDSNPEGWTGGTPTTGTNFTDTNGVSWNFVDIPGVGGMWQEQT